MERTKEIIQIRLKGETKCFQFILWQMGYEIFVFFLQVEQLNILQCTFYSSKLFNNPK